MDIPMTATTIATSMIMITMAVAGEGLITPAHMAQMNTHSGLLH
jgi:hypothetical protein